jgi:hypothetical protein
VTTSKPSTTQSSTLARQLRHVRWIAGGTGSGKSTVAAGLARRFGIPIFAGDRAEHDWLARCTPQRSPHFAALRDQRPGDSWRNRSAEEAFDAMGGGTACGARPRKWEPPPQSIMVNTPEQRRHRRQPDMP